MGRATRTRERWTPLALALVAGCAPVEEAAECVPGAAPSSAPMAPASPDPPVDPAAPAPPAAPFAVTLEAADKAQVWTVEAAHGLLDERFVLAAGPASPLASPALKYAVPVAVTAAHLAADPPVALRVEGTRGGLVELAPGGAVVLRLTGQGFTREGVYRAALTVGGSEPRVYALRVKSASPYPPLGLRTTELARTWEDVPPLGRRGRATAVIAVDAAAADTRPYHIVVRPPAGPPSPGAQHLPSCGIAVHGTGRAGAVAVELPRSRPASTRASSTSRASPSR